MREMAVDSHHHISVDKKVGRGKMHGQHSHRRNPSSSSSSSSSSTSSSTSSSSTSSSSGSSPHRSGYKGQREGTGSKRSKGRSSSKRIPSSSSAGDRSKMKKPKTSSSSRRHSSSKGSKKSHPSKKDHDKLRSHKSSRSPSGRRKTSSLSTSAAKKLLSPTSRSSKRSPSPLPPPLLSSSSSAARKSHKLSPGRSKRSKSRKRSNSPRERLDYRGERLGLPERSLSHGRDAGGTGSHHAGASSSSSRARDPRVVEDRPTRRLTPDQLPRDQQRYSRYEKERLEEFVEPRRERRSPTTSSSRTRDTERKDSHRHRDYDRHDRDHYEERRREDPRREEREREQLRERELRERELRDRELMKERERVELLEREQERERERLREEERRTLPPHTPRCREGRYGREHEFVREREVVLRGSSRGDFEEERDYYASARARGPEVVDSRGVLPVDDRRSYDDSAYERFQSERERGRYESGRGRYEELSLHDRRGLPLDDRRAPPPLDTRFADDRRRSSSSSLDPRLHEAWVEDQRELDRLDHYSRSTLDRHRHPQDWPAAARAPSTWDRHKHPRSRHEGWGDEYGRGGGGSHVGDWGEEAHQWGVDDRAGPAPLHQDQWPQHPRRGYRDEWGGREGEWVDHGPGAYASSRDLGPPPTPQALPPRDRSSQQPSSGRRSRREPIEPLLDPPPSHSSSRHHHVPCSSLSVEEEGLDSARGVEASSQQPVDLDQSHISSSTDGELWEYDPAKGSWVRRTCEATMPAPERDGSPKKEKQLLPPPPPAEPSPEEPSIPAAAAPVVAPPAAGPAAVPAASVEEKKREAPEDKGVEGPESKRPRTESPPPAPPTTEADPVQEKDTFSDISDDVDDILNQEVGGYNEEDTHAINTSQTETTTTTKNVSRENGPSYDVSEILDEEEETHLEEISDDDLEEDRQAKFSVAGALDINWSALMRESTCPPSSSNEVVAGTALKRFKAPLLLGRLGVSTKYARPEVVQHIRDVCAHEASATLTQDAGPQKTEIPPVVQNGGVARLLKARMEARHRVLDSIGPHRRALCAQQDIELRRQLCNLPKQDLIGDNPLLDKELFRHATALLKSC